MSSGRAGAGDSAQAADGGAAAGRHSAAAPMGLAQDEDGVRLVLDDAARLDGRVHTAAFTREVGEKHDH